METVASCHNEGLGDTNPSIPIRVVNLSRTPVDNSRFGTMAGRGLTERLIRREGRRTGRRRFGRFRGIALSALFSALRRNRVGRLGVVVGTSIRNSIRTIGRSLLGVRGSRIHMEVVRNTINTMGSSSIVLTGTSGTVVITFTASIRRITTSGTSHSNVRVGRCDVVCSLVRSIRSTVENVHSIGCHGISANATRIHRICAISDMNSVTNSLIADNAVHEGNGVHIVEGNGRLTSAPVGGLGEFGSSIGSISSNCRYNVSLRG